LSEDGPESCVRATGDNTGRVGLSLGWEVSSALAPLTYLYVRGHVRGGQVLREASALREDMRRGKRSSAESRVGARPLVRVRRRNLESDIKRCHEVTHLLGVEQMLLKPLGGGN